MLRRTQVRLFLGMLLCISIPAALGPVVYRYQVDRDALNLASHALYDARLEMQQAFQATRDFINFGQRDVEFFENGSSEYLLRSAGALRQSRASLVQLQGFERPELQPLISDTIALLARYAATANRLADQLRERGFLEYGVVGRMRSAIQDLERGVEAPELLVQVLKLRRHEKDYIIRNQGQYVDALMEEAQALEADIRRYTPVDAEDRSVFLKHLRDYLEAFRQLVRIDESIGIRSASGLFSELNATEDRLTAEFDRLHSAFDGLAEAESRSLTNYLQAGIGIAATLSVILSLLLSRKLAGPLNALSGKMQRYVESDLKQDANLEDIAGKDDEVGQLARDFVRLQGAIKEYVSSIHTMAFYDTLTGAASRTYLNQRLNEMIGTASGSGQGFSLFFVDLDAFKDVNDGLGHDAGDQLLIEIARRLSEAVRENDFVARLGGDEFCLLLEGLSDEADIVVIAERCIASIEMPVTISGKTFNPQASIGISRYPSDGADARALMQAGDNAMYAAKVAGRHRFEFFRQEMTQKAAERLTIAQELRAAFSRDEFLLHYQPQVNVNTGKITGWEALVRWQHPKRGMVPPDRFIPEVERLGLINELGNWVIREASRQLAAWKAQGLNDMRVSVNVAPRQLSDKNLFHSVSQALKDAGIEPSRFELEVTESGIQSTRDGREVLDKLKSLGVRVAIDDFGTGYSSLGSLRHLPIDNLKIDRCFIRDMVTDSQDAVLLGTIMALSHALKFDIVAEGVETIEQMRILQGLGCDTVQGYLFSKPVPAAEVPELARRNFLAGEENAEKATTPRKLAS